MGAVGPRAAAPAARDVRVCAVGPPRRGAVLRAGYVRHQAAVLLPLRRRHAAFRQRDQGVFRPPVVCQAAQHRAAAALPVLPVFPGAGYIFCGRAEAAARAFSRVLRRHRPHDAVGAACLPARRRAGLPCRDRRSPARQCGGAQGRRRRGRGVPVGRRGLGLPDRAGPPRAHLHDQLRRAEVRRVLPRPGAGTQPRRAQPRAAHQPRRVLGRRARRTVPHGRAAGRRCRRGALLFEPRGREGRQGRALGRGRGRAVRRVQHLPRPLHGAVV